MNRLRSYRRDVSGGMERSISVCWFITFKTNFDSIICPKILAIGWIVVVRFMSYQKFGENKNISVC